MLVVFIVVVVIIAISVCGIAKRCWSRASNAGIPTRDTSVRAGSYVDFEDDIEGEMSSQRRKQREGETEGHGEEIDKDLDAQYY